MLKTAVKNTKFKNIGKTIKKTNLTILNKKFLKQNLT